MAMPKPTPPIIFFFFFFVIVLFPNLSLSSSPPTDHSDFIKSSCKSTLYPTLCVQCLSGYASSVQQDPRQLARAAIEVSLARARAASSYVSKLAQLEGIKPMEYQAVRDCIQNVGASVNRLGQSDDEIGRIGGTEAQADFSWHMSNVKTWVSGALTDENTCLQGFEGPGMDGNVKVAIRSRVTELAQVVSNALALVDQFETRHQAGRGRGHGAIVGKGKP